MRLGGVPLVPTPEDLDLLLAYDWPGNLRELGAVMERAAILGNGRTLRIAAALGPTPRAEAGLRSTGGSTSAADLTIDGAMRRHIELALQQAGGRVEGRAGAAVRLGINPHTLRGRMRRLGVDWNRFRGTAPPPMFGAPLPSLDEAMAAHIRRVLELTRGRVEGRTGAAVRLRINPHTLRARMRRLGIEPAGFRRK
jgi:DNA-binding NtrC family response regulator